MNQATLDIPYSDHRKRLTVLFRMLLAIPLNIVLQLWGIAAMLATILHWFIQVITGKRNAGISKFVTGYAGSAARTMTYIGLMYDEYPGFGNDPGGSPAVFTFTPQPEPVSRLKVLFRGIYSIPWAILAEVLLIVGFLLTIIQWLACIILGKSPRGLWTFLLRIHKYMTQYVVFSLLLTDTPPKFA